MRRSIVLGAALGLAAAGAGPASAAPILSADEPSLEQLRAGYERMERTFVTPENGLFLDPIVLPSETAAVEAFFAQSAILDFETFDGRHPYEVLDSYDEHGDEGNFAGIATVGVAARLMVLRSAGAPADEIARARDAAVRAAIAWHAYGAIGGPGVVARGVRRVTPWAPTDPPFPGPPPEIVPLTDGSGAPLPAEKYAVWRAPVVDGFDGWVWFDDTSKDQVSGYALAVAWLWDALHDDPEVDRRITEDLAADLAGFARALMQVAPERGVDLCIRDADGRLTNHHDLNPRELDPEGAPLPEDHPLRNGFNSLLALGVIRAAYHVSGDPEIGAYYYEELIGRRNLAEDPTTTLSLMYLGPKTNYSNVNMAAIGLATLGRFETDPYVREQLRLALETQWWDAGGSDDASSVEQGWFDAIFGAYSAAALPVIRDRMIGNLGGFPPAPCLERERINCDEAEIAALSCVGIDGVTTIELWDQSDNGGSPIAKSFLPMSIRPDSDFHWRSDPRSVNGGASTRMGPRGDWVAAYWLGRISELGAPDANLSPYARPALPYTLGGEGGGGGAGGGPIDGPEEGDGCSCRAASGEGERAAAFVALALLGSLAAWRRRRQLHVTTMSK